MSGIHRSVYRRLTSHVRQIGLQYHNPARSAGPSKSFLPKVLDSVLPDINSRKRKSPELHGGGGKRKRESSSGDRDVIVIDDDEDEDRDRKPPSSSHQRPDFDPLSPAEVLKVFRLDNKMLRWVDLSVLWKVTTHVGCVARPGKTRNTRFYGSR